MFVNPHGSLNGVPCSHYLPQKTRKLCHTFANTIAIPPRVFLELIGFARDNGDLQGTFVAEGMWDIKKRSTQKEDRADPHGPTMTTEDVS